jgi:hypothetical protein
LTILAENDGGSTNCFARLRLANSSGFTSDFYYESVSISGAWVTNVPFSSSVQIPYAGWWRIEVDLGDDWGDGGPWTSRVASLVCFGSKK